MKQTIYLLIALTGCLLIASCNKKQESQKNMANCDCGPSCTCDANTKNENCGCANCVCTGK